MLRCDPQTRPGQSFEVFDRDEDLSVFACFPHAVSKIEATDVSEGEYAAAYAPGRCVRVVGLGVGGHPSRVRRAAMPRVQANRAVGITED